MHRVRTREHPSFMIVSTAKYNPNSTLIPELDSALFQHAWDRVRQFDMSTASGLGVGIHEARHWHRRAYGGMVQGVVL